MNNWHQNMMGMGNPTNHGQSKGGQGGGKPGLLGVKPLMPPDFMMPDINMTVNPAPPVDPPLPLIGPVLPDNMTTEDMALSDDDKPKESKDSEKKDSSTRDRDSRKDNRDRDRGRSDRRSRERDRDRTGGRHDRNDRFDDRNRSRMSDRTRDRSDRSRDRDRRERRSKWDNNDKDMSRMPDMPVMPGMAGDSSQGAGMMMPGMGMGGMGSSNQGMSMSLGSQAMGGMPLGAQSLGAGVSGMGGMGHGGQVMGGMGTRSQGMDGMGGMGLAGQMGMGGQGIESMGPGGQGMGVMAAGRQGMGGMGAGGQGMGGMGSGSQGMGGMGSGGQGMGGMGQGMMASYGMQNMQNMPNAANMPMMQGMNNMMMNSMMDPNVVMINRQMMLPNQMIYVRDCVLLPPIPGNTMPNRREKPPGCRTIFVGGLQKGVPEDVIADIFQSFGVISDIKVHRQGVCHVRFDNHESVEASFALSGYRFKTDDQTDNEATTLFVDYALNRDDQNEFERSQRTRQKTPPRIEPFNPNSLSAVGEKIKSDEHFSEAAPSLVVWLERGECNKRNANTFYSLIQASNNQVRRLFNEKMSLDDEYHNMKASLRERFTKVVEQFELVAKILAVAKHQRVSDHFTKQQRRNIEMWLKMTEEVENIKEEFNATFDDEETERVGRHVVPAEKYEQLRMEHETLVYELEGYKNEAYLAKDEAERKFEKFKAHWIAQQALQNKGQGQVFPPLPPPPIPNMATVQPLSHNKPQPPPPTPDDDKVQTSGPAVPPTEAKLISILTAFLMVHPLGASLDYLVSYVRSMVPNVTQATVHQTLQKHSDVFVKKTSGIGANIEHRWGFVTFDIIKREAQ